MPDDIASVRLIAAAQGFDLQELAAQDTRPILHPDGWIMDDPIAWRVENAEQILATAVPAGFRGADLRRSPAPVRDWAAQHVEQFPYEHPFLLLSGFPGTGKTYVAWALLKAVVRALAATGRGLDWQFVTHPELNDQLRPKPDQSHAYAVDRYLRTQLLVLDDLGAGRISDFTVENTLRIINYRYDQRLPTIYTTNERSGDLLNLLSERVYSRLYSGDELTITGVDRRLSGQDRRR